MQSCNNFFSSNPTFPFRQKTSLFIPTLPLSESNPSLISQLLMEVEEVEVVAAVPALLMAPITVEWCQRP